MPSKNILKLFIVFFMFYSSNTRSQKFLKKRNLIIGGIITTGLLGRFLYTRSDRYKYKCKCNEIIEDIEKYTPTAYFKQNELENIKQKKNIQEKLDSLNKVVQELKEKKVYAAFKSSDALKDCIYAKIKALQSNIKTLLEKKPLACNERTENKFTIYTFFQDNVQKLIIKKDNSKRERTLVQLNVPLPETKIDFAKFNPSEIGLYQIIFSTLKYFIELIDPNPNL